VGGDYEFFSSVDIEPDRFYQEVHHHGFFLTDDYDPQPGATCSRIEQMSPEEHAACLATGEEEEG
jgi:hypothetical protein